MKKDKRDDLIILCDRLESCNKKLCKRNEVICAKNKIREYVGNDINKKLKLKALIDIHDDGNRTGEFARLSTLISAFSFCAVIIYNLEGRENSFAYEGYALMAMIVIAMVCLINIVFSKKNNARNKWIRFIKIALEDI